MYYIALHILFHKILSMWGKRLVWLVYKGSLFYTIFSSSTPNFAILSLTPYIIRQHASLIEGTLIDLPCGTTWQLCPVPRASVRNSALPLSCPRDVPLEPGSSADPPYHAPIEIKSTVRKLKWIFSWIFSCLSYIRLRIIIRDWVYISKSTFRKQKWIFLCITCI